MTRIVDSILLAALAFCAAVFSAGDARAAQQQSGATGTARLVSQSDPAAARAATHANQSQAQAALARQRAAQQQQLAKQSASNSRQQEQRKPFLSALFGGGAPDRSQNAQPQRQTPRPSSPAPQNGADFHANSQHVGIGIGIGGGTRSSTPSAPLSPDALMKASSSPQDAQEALSRVPWKSLPQNTSETLRNIASSATMYRRLPMAGGRCNPELFDFFLSYPNTVVELWRHMGYDEIEMKALGGDRYSVREKNGSVGNVQVLYQDSELLVAYASGSYHAPAMLRPVDGEAFLVLQTRYTEDPSLTPLVICRLDVFVRIKNPGVDFLARAFNAAVGKIADSNFEQTLAFIDSVSQTAEQDPRDFQSVVASLPGLSPQGKQILTAKTFEIARQASARQRGERVDYKLIAKRNAPNPGYARIISRGDNYAPGAGERSFAAAQSGGNAGFSSSGASSLSGRGGAGFSSSGLAVAPGDEFALAEDGGWDESAEWSETSGLMTGEDFLSSRSSVGVKLQPGASSLAKVGSKPSTRANAMARLSELESEEETFTLQSDLSTEDDFYAESIATSDDDALTFDFDLAEAGSGSPAPMVERASRPAPVLPSLRAPGRGSSASIPNAAPLAAAEEDEELPEITFGEDGELTFEFRDDEEDAPAEPAAIADGSADAEALDLPSLELAEDGAEPVRSPQVAPYAAQTAASAEPDESADAESAEPDPADSWTRASFATPRRPDVKLLQKRPLKSAVKEIEKGAKKFELKTREEISNPERPKIITKRYALPQKSASNDGAAAAIGDDASEGEVIQKYHWTATEQQTPVRTAAVPSESAPAKVPTFRKPNLQ